MFAQMNGHALFQGTAITTCKQTNCYISFLQVGLLLGNVSHVSDVTHGPLVTVYDCIFNCIPAILFLL